MTYRDRGWTWVSIALAYFGGGRSYPVKAIDGVYEAKGVSTTLILSGGRKVNLPVVGSSLGNSIRAWLKQST